MIVFIQNKERKHLFYNIFIFYKPKFDEELLILDNFWIPVYHPVMFVWPGGVGGGRVPTSGLNYAYIVVD